MKLYLIVVLVCLLLATPLLPAHAQQQDTPSIEIQGYTWNKSTLRILIVRSDNETWWQPYLVNMSRNAVQQWNDAISYFSERYSDYAYLENLLLLTTVSNEYIVGYDINIMFTESLSTNGQRILGLASILPNRNGVIQSSNVTIAIKSQTNTLTQSDLHGITLHEIGHSLGLGHSNSSRDLMYPSYDLFSANRPISSLNFYGVALFFGWMSPSFEPVTPLAREVTLPIDMIYEYAPVLNPIPRSPFDNSLIRAVELMYLLIQNNPVIMVMFIVLVFLFFVLGVIFFKTKPMAKTK